MFWDMVSPLYDFFEKAYNRQVYTGTGLRVAKEIDPGDVVLECACGTGAISECIAPACRLLIATDMSQGMLQKAQEKCRRFGNVRVHYADMSHLRCRDDRFDKVVAGNVLHLLEDPEQALRELLRVCKPGGRVILPTYINEENDRQRRIVRLLERLGADFKRQFTFDSYRDFFRCAGYTDVRYTIVEGRMACAIAILTKNPSRCNDTGLPTEQEV